MYKFRITVQALARDASQPNLQFEVENHDDILAVAERLSGKLGLDQNATNAFAVGMKLFGETILQNREKELFQSIKPAFGEFMKNLKREI